MRITSEMYAANSAVKPVIQAHLTASSRLMRAGLGPCLYVHMGETSASLCGESCTQKGTLMHRRVDAQTPAGSLLVASTDNSATNLA